MKDASAFVPGSGAHAQGQPPPAAAAHWFSPRAFAAFLGLSLFACFPEVLLGHESFFFRDYGVLGYPFVYFHRECFWNGELPLWNPLSNCGAPFLAQWGTMALYPFSLIYLLLPLPWSLSLFCFFHVWLGGMGMYFLARRWTDSPFAACVGGTAYVFSGVTLASFMWPNYLVALGWMPFVVMLAQRAWREGGRLVIAAGIVSALQLGSGAPEVVLFTWLIVGALWLLDLVQRQSPGGRMVFRASLIIVIAAGLMAAQLLPFFDLLQHSQRDRNFSTSKWSLPLWGWANFILPLFHCVETPQGQYVQPGQAFLSSVYLGAGVVALALCSLCSKSKARTWILLGLALFGIGMAFGDQTPLFNTTRKVVPLLGVGRFAVKFLFLAAFIVPILAAITVARLEANRNDWRRLTISAGGILATMALLLWLVHERRFFDYSAWPENNRVNMWMSWKDAAANAGWRAGFLVAFIGTLLARIFRDRRAGIFGFAALALMVADARTHLPNHNPRVGVEEIIPSFWPKELAKPQHGDSRVMITREAEEALLRSSIKDLREYWRSKRRALWSNLNLLEGIPKVNGSSTLQLREQAELQRWLYSGTNRWPNGLLDFLGVKYLSAPNDSGEWTLRPSPLPLVTAGQRPVFADLPAFLAALSDDTFDPRATVYLPGNLRSLVPITNASRIQITSPRTSINSVAAEIIAEEAGLVIIAQSYHTRWRATVDGKETPVLRANHAFQAIVVPRGQHAIRLVYADKGFRAGAIISLITLSVCGVVWARKARSNTRNPAPH